jgi:hypothetical protein
MENLDTCGKIGTSYERDDDKFYGFGCTTVELIKLWDEHTIHFTPKLEDEIVNEFHVDIYDGLLTNVDGEANKAVVNLKREYFKEIWKPYRFSDIDKDDQVKPILNMREMIEKLKVSK